MEEVRGDHVGREGCPALLEHEADNVVADVALALQLLRICLRVGEQRGHVEHDLLALMLGVHAVLSGLAELGVQAAPVAAVLGEEDLAADQLDESLHGGAVVAVAEERLLRGLAHLLVDDAELEVVDQDMPAHINKG